MNMQEFLTKVGSDEALAGKLSKAASPDEAYAIAKEAGLTESFETFVEAMKKLNESVGEMTDKDVEAVTGGGNSGTVAAIVTAVSAVGTFALTRAAAT